MTPRFLLGLVPLIMGGALLLCVLSQKDDTPAPPTLPNPATLPEPDFRLDVAQWHAEFAEDSKAAVEKYKGKIVELSGTVEFVAEDRAEQVGCVFLKVEGAPLRDRCATIDKQPWKKVSPGSKVRIRGKVPEYGLPRDLAEAVIVEAGPNPAVVATAPELARAYAADRQAATEKYDDKWANLEGEVIGKSSAKYYGPLLTLKGENSVVVSCGFGDRNKHVVEDIEVGSKVKVFGQLSLWKDKEILVNSTLLTEAK